MVPVTPRSGHRHRVLAPTLQRRPTPQQLELLDPTRVQAATSTHPNRSRFIGMNGSKRPSRSSPPRAPFDKGRVAIGDFTDELVMLTMRPQRRSHMPSTTAWIS